jgi:23S rRNA pseudouridine1911/1915/1917 synthase
MNTPLQWTVDADGAGSRLDRFLAARCPEFSRSRLQDFIRGGSVTVGSATAKPSTVLEMGDMVELLVPPEVAPSPIEAQALPLRVLFEDESMLVLDKPAGMVVHPGAGNKGGTIANAVLHHCEGIQVAGGEERPGIVHRLDKETSGCLLIAKTETAHRNISTQFAERTVAKTYLALVEGVPRMPHGTIDAPIARHPVHRQRMTVSERGREALTRYRVLASEGRHGLLECRPRTGRTHQIRVHLKHLGHPVAGDPVYGRRGSFERHLLHAWKISLRHPLHGGEVSFQAPLPPDFPEWTLAATT